MIKTIMLVGTGGFIGSVSRYFLSRMIQSFFPVVFPYGTLAVNVLGCFLIGFILGLAENDLVLPEWRLFLATGFCGGFTTFSTFADENINLYLEKEYFYLLLYATISYVIGIAAVWVGIVVSKLIMHHGN